jgi:NTE family protein
MSAIEPNEHGLENGIGLCLSGGGYRAMLFHLGVLRTVNRLGLLRGLRRISSVSGGSITAGTLGCHWSSLRFDSSGSATNLDEVIGSRIRALASTSIDVSAVLYSLLPFTHASDFIAAKYGKFLVGEATTDDLPADDHGPRFIFNAANLQTGVLFRFSRPYMADYKLGVWDRPKIPLAQVMAASSAFPPFLSPFVLRPKGEPRDPDKTFVSAEGAIHRKLVRRITLTDGGVYDNFGLETVQKRLRTVIVSDAGMRLAARSNTSANWFSQLLRVRELFDDQVRSLRIRWLSDNLSSGVNDGVYFSIRGEIVARGVWDPGDKCPPESKSLANIRTALSALSPACQAALVAWGERHSSAALASAQLGVTSPTAGSTQSLTP